MLFHHVIEIQNKPILPAVNYPLGRRRTVHGVRCHRGLWRPSGGNDVNLPKFKTLNTLIGLAF